jgi:hypothetical protein
MSNRGLRTQHLDYSNKSKSEGANPAVQYTIISSLSVPVPKSATNLERPLRLL